jgi:Flp pilus assembly protein CpaB
LKRSNRLVLLIGVFLAVIAFVGVIVLSQGGGGGGGTPQEPTTKNVVVAAVEIPLGTVIEEGMVELKEVDVAAAATDAYLDASQVVGQVARQEVLAGQQITVTITTGGAPGAGVTVPPGQRAMSVLVDQVTGVGTLIKTGDFVDVLVRFEIQPNNIDEDTGEATPIEGIDTTSTKLLIQGVQVVGVILPPPPAAAEGEAPPQGTTLSGQQELVILSLTPAQAEVMKFVEDTASQTVSLVLRSPEDFLDAEGNPRLPESPCLTAPLPTTPPAATPGPGESPAPTESPEETTPPYRGCETTDGVVLSTLVFQYGVLVPNITGAGPAPVIPSPSPEPTEPAASPTPTPTP